MIEEAIKNELVATKIEIEETRRGGQYTLKAITEGREQYLLSKYNPAQSALEKLDALKYNKETVWILLGLGLGYMLEHIRQQVGEKATIIIVEPTEENFQMQMEKPWVDRLVRQGNTYVVTGMEFDYLGALVQTKVPEMSMNNLEIIELETYVTCYPTYYAEVLRTIKSSLMSKLINRNTLQLFNSQLTRNIILNKNAVANALDMTDLKDKYKGMPAVLVAGGPSLDKNIHHLKKFNGIVISCSRTLKNVRDQGVMPDFLTSIDPADKMVEYLQGEGTDEMALVTLPVASAPVVGQHRGRCYVVDNGTHQKMVEKLIGVEVPRLAYGGSVATLSLSVAAYMGCSPIVFIGQDLAYTDFRSHANTWNAKELVVDEAYYEYIKGYNGGTVPSRNNLIEFLKFIEGFIKDHGDSVYINATEGGAAIQGTIQMTLEEAIRSYNPGEKVIIEHTQRQLVAVDDVDEQIAIALKELEDLKKKAERGKILTANLQREIDKPAHKRNRLVGRWAKELNDKISVPLFSATFLKTAFGQVVESLFQDIKMLEEFQSDINESVEDANDRVLRMMHVVYSVLIERCKAITDTVEKALEEEANGERE